MTKLSKKRGTFQSPKGMHDILPQDQIFWEKIWREVKDVAESYNFLRIDTSILEDAALFERSLGATSDVVERQMFLFKTKGGDSLVLRPEGTASIARAYLEHGLSQLGQPLKLYYLGPMFRYEQPQAGRFRQFYQAGFEIIGGDEDAIYDAQAILTCYRLIESLKIKQLMVKINTIGCRNCRPNYKKKLADYYKDRVASAKERIICKDCERRLAINPLRLLDCKNELCANVKKDAPIILNGLCAHCKAHFKNVLEYLEELKIPYEVDHFLVRGLDYYNRTVFEIFTDMESKKDSSDDTKSSEPADKIEKSSFALGGGGRYDYLMELLGGKETPAVGGAVGLDRLVYILKAFSVPQSGRAKSKVFLIHIGELAKKKSLALIEELKREGIDTAESLGKESLKAQLRAADKSGAQFALIFGQKEALENSIILRDLKTGAQETVPLHRIAKEVKRRMK